MSKLKGATPEQLKSISDGVPEPGTPESPAQISVTNEMPNADNLAVRVTALENVFSELQNQFAILNQTYSRSEKPVENSAPETHIESLPAGASPGGVSVHHNIHSSPGGLGGGNHSPEPEQSIIEFNPAEGVKEDAGN